MESADRAVSDTHRPPGIVFSAFLYYPRPRKLFQEGVWASPRGPYVVRILQAWAILEATQGRFDDARKYFG